MAQENPDVPALVRDLLRPGALGPAAQRVELRTTHASWVFLAGDQVFKVKRPVDLGFLDYRTVEDRRRACLEEVRVNARLAPQVYLDVVPIHRAGQGHALSGDGPVVDWAVHMRRLPDEATAAAALAGGTLDPPALESVARLLAGFLRDAAPAPSFGTPEALAANLDENFAQTRPFIGSLIAPATFEAVREFQRGTLARQAARFARRIADQRIREGHGDVRLEHIYFLPAAPAPVIIDAIEFNQRFRCGDVAAEIAFPAMELQAAGRADLAAGLVARFAEQSDDFDLFGVLDFYLSYRAWVRGKVAALVAADATTGPELRAAKQAEARRCFAVAEAAAQPSAGGAFLIAVGGVIGSGKSTLAQSLGRRLAIPVVSSDATRKRLAGLELTTPGDDQLYAPDARERTYAEILRRAGQVLEAGRGVILDATFTTRAWRARAAAAAAAAGARFTFVEARAPVDRLRARLRARSFEQPEGASASDATETLLDRFLAEYEPPGTGDPDRCLSIDTSGSVETALQSALDGLAAAGVWRTQPQCPG